MLSTCSAADAAFARTSSGLPFFDVLLSDCHLDSQKRGRFFKPRAPARVVLAERRAANPSAGRRSLLGALTVARVREKLKSAKAWAPFHYVYYSEADQVRHPQPPYLDRFPLVSADFWTSDHPSERDHPSVIV